MKYIAVFFVCLFTLTGCEEKIYEDNNLEEHIIIKEDKIDVFSEIHLHSLMEFKENVEVISDDLIIDAEYIGEKKFDIIYKVDKKKYKFEFVINVVDSIPPRIIGGSNRSVNKGYNGNLCDLITYGDNYDGIVNCSVVGDYNTDEVNTYNIKYILTDSSNNKSEINSILNVKNPTKTTSTNTTRAKKQFVDVIANYKDDNNEIGIDVSKWQGEIDFEKVKNAGASFVMMRIGVQKSAGKDLEIDPYFEQNLEKAKKSGLKVGVYLYSIATSKEEAVNHAKWVINTLNNERLELPIVFDWENWSKWNTYQMSFHDINSCADEFIKTVKDAGYEGMLYSSKFYLENIWENRNNNLVWLAHYTDKTSYKGDYYMWQLSDTGRIDGINGDVDIDILYKK